MEQEQKGQDRSQAQGLNGGNSQQLDVNKLNSAVINLIADENNFNQAGTLLVKAYEKLQEIYGDSEILVQDFVAKFLEEIVTTKNAIENQDRIINAMKFLCSLTPTVKNIIMQKLFKQILLVISIERQVFPAPPKTEFYAEAVAFAAAVSLGLMQLEQVVKTMRKFVANAPQRNAGLVTLAKLVDLCDEQQFYQQGSGLRAALLDALGAGALEPHNLKEVNWITQKLKLVLDQPVLKQWRSIQPSRQGHDSGAQIVQVSYDHTDGILFSGGYDGKIVYWDAMNRKALHRLVLEDQQPVSLNWCAGMQALFGCTRSCGNARHGALFAYQKNAQPLFYHHSNALALYVVRPLLEAQNIAVSETMTNGRHVVKIYDINRIAKQDPNGLAQPDVIIVKHTARISDIQVDQFQPNVLMTTSYDCDSYIWDLRAPTEPAAKLGVRPTHGSYVHSGDLVLSSQGPPLAVTAGNDFKLKFWELRKTSNPVNVFELDDSAVIKVRLDKLSGIIVSGSQAIASTMDSIYQIDIRRSKTIPLNRDISPEKRVATRDFVWVGYPDRRLLYASQNDGKIIAYATKELTLE